MDEVKIEIETAIKTLGLGPDKIRLLDNQDGEKVLRECLTHFVNSGDRRWWWEDFNQPSFTFLDLDKPFEHLTDIIPEPNRKVWLIVEDIYEPFYPVYEALPEIIGHVIGECFGFEYYIIAKDKKWLLCENHHNRLIGVGESLREKNVDKLKV